MMQVAGRGQHGEKQKKSPRDADVSWAVSEFSFFSHFISF
jgi:hypothetical protein